MRMNRSSIPALFVILQSMVMTTLCAGQAPVPHDMVILKFNNTWTEKSYHYRHTAAGITSSTTDAFLGADEIAADVGFLTTAADAPLALPTTTSADTYYLVFDLTTQTYRSVSYWTGPKPASAKQYQVGGELPVSAVVDAVLPSRVANTRDLVFGSNFGDLLVDGEESFQSYAGTAAPLVLIKPTATVAGRTIPWAIKAVTGSQMTYGNDNKAAPAPPIFGNVFRSTKIAGTQDTVLTPKANVGTPLLVLDAATGKPLVNPVTKKPTGETYPIANSTMAYGVQLVVNTLQGMGYKVFVP